jgi:hypothetical protein
MFRRAKLVTKKLFVCWKKARDKGVKAVQDEGLHELPVLKQVESLVSSWPAGAAVKSRLSQQKQQPQSVRGRCSGRIRVRTRLSLCTRLQVYYVTFLDNKD